MASYTSTERTNYFAVESLQALITEAKLYGVTLTAPTETPVPGQTYITAKNGRIAIIGDLPSEPFLSPQEIAERRVYSDNPTLTEADYDAIQIHETNNDWRSAVERLGIDPERYTDDFAMFIAQHLIPGEVAVFMHVGHEKHVYVNGVAEAVTRDCTAPVIVNLDDIYDKAAQAFGVEPRNITTVHG